MFSFQSNVCGQAQTTFSRAKINLIGRDLKDLANVGIETDHGLIAKGRHFVSDFSKEELVAIMAAGFEYEILIADVQQYYANPNRKSELDLYEKLANRGSACDPGQGDFNYKTPSNYADGSMGGYFKYEEMLTILDNMHTKYPNLITAKALVDTTKTHDGNQLLYVKVSDNPTMDEMGEPEVLYTALHHAREANSLSQMIFYLWYLLENYASDPLIQNIVNNTQMYFIPCVNPDGYIINQTTNPGGGGLWRKNAWKDGTGAVKGVDLNRNYGYNWGYDNQGSSANPSSSTYRGTSGFSEPETTSIRIFCEKHAFSIALNYHTFGNFLIHPWGFNDSATDEDALFKAMGRVMNKENNFLLGTGTETVGYTVNGTSDDWMYGEDIEKKKIYSMTPEVGYSFWPSKVDIDYLNRSCMWMNLSTALLTLNYYDASEFQGREYLSLQNSKINIKVVRSGLKDGSATISLISNTAGCIVIEPTRVVNLPIGKDTVLSFDLTVDASQSFLGGIDLSLSSNVDGLIRSKSLTKLWIKDNLEVVYFNQCNSLNEFDAFNWQLTDEISFSAPTCITDSPLSRYPNNSFASITTTAEINLRDATNAFLNFRAKWDVEQSYDYVTVSASKDNVDFFPLCGIFSTLGNNNQAFNTPIYDGKQNEWIQEEINLSYFLGSERLYIKFELRSDQGVDADGFYFDDLLVKASFVPSSSEDFTYEKVNVVPNMLSAGQNINLANTDLLPMETIVTIEGTDGRVVGTHKLGTQIAIPSSLADGMYFVIFKQGSKTLISKKIAVIH